MHPTGRAWKDLCRSIYVFATDMTVIAVVLKGGKIFKGILIFVPSRKNERNYCLQAFPVQTKLFSHF